MLQNLTTESTNPASAAIDRLTALEIVHLMNSEDAAVPAAVAREAEPIAQAVEVIARQLEQGGRLIYLGAGTSGRLGVLDAAECPPTFNTRPEQVVGLIAGGPAALTRSIEGAEDHPELAAADLQAIGLTARDVVVGIATSGRTPYVVGGLGFARNTGAFTVGLSCNRDSQLAAAADLTIAPIVGPEVIGGSTRLKAGTATKLVLNMLSTGAMVLLGKTFGNLMVDVRATNEKLTHRSRRIVAALTELAEDEAAALLGRCGGEVKTAIVAQRRGVSPDEARRLIAAAGGHLRQAIEGHASPVVHEAPADRGPLLLGIEGGGTKTVAWLAVQTLDSYDVLGRGTAGPSNANAIGFPRATLALRTAIDAAWHDAGCAPSPVAAACFAMAGVDRDDDRARIGQWVQKSRLAAKVQIVNDAVPLLTAGTPEGWGVALVAGTGSIAVGRNNSGQTARTGGWGYLMGDEGSAYAIALEGLRQSACAADGRGPATELLQRFLVRLNIEQPEQLISTLYQQSWDRAALAALADVVTAAAEDGDAAARAILDDSSAALADLVATTARKLELGTTFPLALTGGIALNSAYVQKRLEQELAARGLHASPIAPVPEPIRGALLSAAALK